MKHPEPLELQPTWSQLLRTACAQAPPDVEAIDAELLLAHALGRSRAGLYARLADAPEAGAATRFRELWRRRCAGEPYAYLVGKREFAGREFAVSPAVLIPRADTEVLLESALARWPRDREGVVVDAGTGSGALAISFLLERPRATVLAVDRSRAALAVAHANARCLQAEVGFWLGDWLDAVADSRVDMLLANPPYLAEADPHLPGLLASGEPAFALVAGADGLRDLGRLAEAGVRRLRTGGWLLLEHGSEQGAGVRRLLERRGYAEVCTLPDLEGRDRVTGGRAP